MIIWFHPPVTTDVGLPNLVNNGFRHSFALPPPNQITDPAFMQKQKFVLANICAYLYAIQACMLALPKGESRAPFHKVFISKKTYEAQTKISTETSYHWLLRLVPQSILLESKEICRAINSAKQHQKAGQLAS